MSNNRYDHVGDHVETASRYLDRPNLTDPDALDAAIVLAMRTLTDARTVLRRLRPDYKSPRAVLILTSGGVKAYDTDHNGQLLDQIIKVEERLPLAEAADRLLAKGYAESDIVVSDQMCGTQERAIQKVAWDGGHLWQLQ